MRVQDPWHRWFYDNQIAGYIKGYDVGSNGKLHFMTVKGAGHMVATYKPQQALALFTRYISGTLSGMTHVEQEL